jgi:hypothetical protein
MKKVLLIVGICIGSTGYSDGQDLSKNVFVVTVGCGISCKQTIQTGFRLNKYHGILTTLHGLSNVKTITAQNRSTNVVYTNLTIVKVDIERDVALLSNPLIESEPLNSFLSARPSTFLESTDNYFSLGHPYGVEAVGRNDIRLASPPFITLSDRIPPNERNQYDVRNSPRTTIQVIEMRYNFGNGESGEPILDKQNHVIGINDGGFANINISWAIPINNLDFSKPVNLSAVNALAAEPIELHSFQTDIEQIAGKSVGELSDLFQSWYLSFRKMNKAYNLTPVAQRAGFDPVSFFDISTITQGLKNSLGLDMEAYDFLNGPIYSPTTIEVNTAIPIEYIPVNVAKPYANKSVFTVYFRYDLPIYEYKEPPGQLGPLDDGSLPYFMFNTGDQIQSDFQEHRITEYKKANLQGIFILDDSYKLVAFTGIHVVFSDNPYFQKW